MTTERPESAAIDPQVDAAAKWALGVLFGVPLVLVFGAFRGPFALAIPVGLIFVWRSGSWLRGDKVIATVLVMTMLVLPFLLVWTVAQEWGMGALALVLLWPGGALLAGIYLTLRLWSRRRARSSTIG